MDIEAFDGPVGVEFDVSTAVQAEYEPKLDLAGGGFGYIPNYETPPATFHQFWGIGPGD